MDPLIGKTLQDGKYTLEQELGRGGSGVTFRATHRYLGQAVVIKTLNEPLRQHPNFSEFERKFRDEARRLALCIHPNIVRVSDFFTEDALPFMVMEYIPGQTLEAIVFPNQPLSESTAIHYIRQVGAALRVVHRNGLLHRDVKPENIILRQDTQEVVLIDFGIAREFKPGLTQTHTSLISAGYAPIEQYIPQAKRSPATDIYGLAATLYALLTAQAPVASILRTWDGSAQENRQPMPAPRELQPQISSATNQAVMQGMAMEAHHRPATVDEWLSLLPSSLDRHRPAGGYSPSVSPEAQSYGQANSPGDRANGATPGGRGTPWVVPPPTPTPGMSGRGSAPASVPEAATGVTMPLMPRPQTRYSDTAAAPRSETLFQVPQKSRSRNLLLPAVAAIAAVITVGLAAIVFRSQQMEPVVQFGSPIPAEGINSASPTPEPPAETSPSEPLPPAVETPVAAPSAVEPVSQPQPEPASQSQPSPAQEQQEVRTASSTRSSIRGLPTGTSQRQIEAALGREPDSESAGYWPNTRSLLYRLPNQIDMGFSVDRSSGKVRQTEVSFPPSADLQEILPALNGMVGGSTAADIRQGLQQVQQRQANQHSFNTGRLEGVIERNNKDRIYIGVWDADFH